MRYEYELIEPTTGRLVAELNRLAGEGWETVHASMSPDRSWAVLLKREYKKPKPPPDRGVRV